LSKGAIGGIVGGVVGGLLLGLFLVVLLLLRRKRSRVVVGNRTSPDNLPEGTASQNGRVTTEEPLGGRLAKE
jgi:hypothetical protein